MNRKEACNIGFIGDDNATFMLRLFQLYDDRLLSYRGGLKRSLPQSRLCRAALAREAAEIVF
jgi:hypothetical protein